MVQRRLPNYLYVNATGHDSREVFVFADLPMLPMLEHLRLHS